MPSSASEAKNADVAAAQNLSWRVPAIDGVRALAMLMVYSYHVWQFAGSPSLNTGVLGASVNLFGAFHTFPAGVDLFMVLSGFCLFLPLCKSPSAVEKWDLRHYFVRRLRRIVPPYYAAIVYAVLLPQLLVILFRLLGQEAKWQTVPSFWQFFTHLFFIHTLFTQTWDGINGSFWSLGLEAQFYLAFPLVVLGYRKFKSNIFWMIIGMSVIYRILGSLIIPSQAGSSTEFLYSIFFLGRWMQFALGMTAAWIVAQHWTSGLWRSPASGTWAIVSSLLLYGLAVSDTVAGVTLFPLRDLLLAVCYSAGIVALCITKTPVRALFDNKAIVGLGFISYSFFLIHQPTAWYISELLKKKLGLEGIGLFALLCSLGFLIVLAIAYAFFLVFERPFLSSKTIKENPGPSPELLPLPIRVSEPSRLSLETTSVASAKQS